MSAKKVRVLPTPPSSTATSDLEDLSSLDEIETISTDSGVPTTVSLTPSPERALGLSEDKNEDYFVEGFDVMQKDFDFINGQEDRWASEFGPTLMSARKPEDIPCKFHDGVSGTCWKGSSCMYHHKLNTGGVFAKRHPEIAFATSHQAPITSVSSLPEKPQLQLSAEIRCTVIHVESPSEFYIRPVNSNPECIVVHMEKLMDKIHKNLPRQKKQKAEKRKMDMAKAQAQDKLYRQQEKFRLTQDPPIYFRTTFDDYLSDSEDCSDPPSNATYLKILNEELTKLGQCNFYKNMQRVRYHPGIELVAVQKDDKWWRAWVQSEFGGRLDDNGDPEEYFVQLLETGERLTVRKVDMCQLPRKLSSIGVSVFKCTIFGVSPLFGMWTKDSIELFKELVMKQELSAIIQILPEENTVEEGCHLFESTPYSVKLFVSQGNKEVNVTRELVKAGGLEWNPYCGAVYFEEDETEETEPSKLNQDDFSLDKGTTAVVANSSGSSNERPCKAFQDSNTL